MLENKEVKIKDVTAAMESLGWGERQMDGSMGLQLANQSNQGDLH